MPGSTEAAEHSRKITGVISEVMIESSTEHDLLAKVEVASSSLVTRSKRCEQFRSQRFFVCSDADDPRTGPPRRGPYDPLGWL